MRLGVFGGTFDPVHVGHLVLAETARWQLTLDRVLWIPAGDPWRKSGREVTAAQHRLEMVRLATAENAAFEALDCEVLREGPTYTVDTLEELKKERDGAELFLLLGSDAWDDLPNWKDPARIQEIARLAVAGRGAEAAVGARTLRLTMPEIAISSTDIRRRVGQRESIRYLVPDAVEEYIQRTGLYQT